MTWDTLAVLWFFGTPVLAIGAVMLGGRSERWSIYLLAAYLFSLMAAFLGSWTKIIAGPIAAFVVVGAVAVWFAWGAFEAGRRRPPK
jgi:hypothetical protein